MSQQKHEPIAVIGAACRLPGGANTPDAFWELLASGRDAIGPIPANRWDRALYYDPNPSVPGRMYVQSGAFIDDVEGFDAAFFGISGTEAETLDPQQRHLLEVTWEALETAGHTASVARTRTGVFLGVFFTDYEQRTLWHPDPTRIDAFVGTGARNSMVSGRISYWLDISGPSITVDTACSSSLVAIHLAMRSLRDGECPMAIVGASNLMLSPRTTIYLSHVGALAPDGRSKTFDAAADGFGRGEGIAAIVLKRLSDAQRDGDPIVGVIQGSATNHDGRSNGLTSPSARSQADVLSQAIADAGVDPKDVGYVEAHGTGTILGDPIEFDGIRKAYGVAGPTCWVGSVKTNIGHLDAAAGLAGLLKVLWGLKHRRVPPHLHFREPNPKLRIEGTRFDIPVNGAPWETGRLAGLSSFGLSGTNAHLVIGPAPERAPTPDPRTTLPVCLSAHSEAALRELAAAAGRQVSRWPLGEVSLGFAKRRAFPYRLAVAGESSAEVAEKLKQWANDRHFSSVTHGIAPRRRPKVAWLFPGQGTQRNGMGQTLYDEISPFREALDQAVDLFDPHLPAPLREVMWGDDERLHETLFTQCAVFVVSYATARMWQAWGLMPSAVIGHSLGEVTAAVIAGVLDLDDAVPFVVARGQAMESAPKGGAMAAISRPTDEVQALVDSTDGVEFACYNAPNQSVITGEATAVRAIAERLDADARVLRIPHATHSSHMSPILPAIGEAADRVAWRSPKIPMATNVTGGFAPDLVGTSAYWRKQARSPVRFSDGIAALREHGCTVFLEVGPSAVLAPLGQMNAGGADLTWVSTSAKDERAHAVVADAVGRLFVSGVPVDLAAFHADYRPTPAPVPTTRWQHQRYWVEHDDPPPAAGGVEYQLERVPVSWSEVGSGVRSSGLPGSANVFRVFGEDRLNLVTALGGEATDAPRAIYDLTLDTDDEDLATTILKEVFETAKEAVRTRLPLWFVFRDADISPLGSMLRGFVRVLGQEHPDLLAGIIDLDASADASHVLPLLGAPPGREWRVEGGALFHLELRHSPAPAPVETMAFPAGSAAWITGGNGALALRLAYWLSKRRVKHIWLMSRSGLSAAGEELVTPIREAGVVVHDVRGDVSRRADVARVLSEIDESGVPLSGVFHLAGSIEDTLLENLTWAEFAPVLAPKVNGAAYLHDATKDRDLAAFCLFSSMSGILGNPGQANYAAANGWLDGLAGWRRSQGLLATSIRWGLWETGGMASSPMLREFMKVRGVHPLSLGQVTDVLDRTLQSSAPTATAANIDWVTFRAFHPSDRIAALLATLATEPAPRDPAPAANEAPAAPVPADIDGWLRANIDELMGSDSGVDPEQPLAWQGFDSRSAMTLKDRIQRTFGVKLDKQDAVGGMRLSALAERLRVENTPAEAQMGASPSVSEKMAPDPLQGWANRAVGLVVGLGLGWYLAGWF